MKKLLLLVGCLAMLAGTSYAQMPTSNWINVRDYGAKGDGKTDDWGPISNAIRATGTRGVLVVYFPPSWPGYFISGPQTLPSLPGNHWITLYLDAPLLLGGTLTMSPGYVIHGNSGGQIVSFSTDTLGWVSGVGPVNPVIYIATTDVRLENLQVGIPPGSDGIVTKHAAQIYLKNVWAQGDQGGIPVRFQDGFGYHIEGGGFYSTSSAPTIEFSGNNECSYVGILVVRGTYLNSRGISVKGCSGMYDMTFEDIIYENAQNALVTIDSQSPSGVWGLSIKDVTISDDIGAPLIDAHCNGRCVGIFGVTIVNFLSSANQITTGDPISDLEIWSPDPRRIVKLAQTTGYVLHVPGAIYNAMPTYQVNGSANFFLTPFTQPPQTIQAGQTATYRMTLSASTGFKQLVELSCTGAPPGSTCSVSPPSVSVNGQSETPISVSLTTTARSNTLGWLSGTIRFRALKSAPTAGFFALVVVLLCTTWLARRRGPQTWAIAPLLVTLACAAVFAASCAQLVAGSSNAGTNGKPATPGLPAANAATPSGNYSLLVTGKTGDGKDTYSVQLQLTVQ